MDRKASTSSSSGAAAAATRSKAPSKGFLSAFSFPTLSVLLLLLLILLSASGASQASFTNTSTAELAAKIELLASGNKSAIVAAKASALNRTLGVISSLASLVVPETTVVLPGPQAPYPPVSAGTLPTIAFTGSAGLFIFYAGVAQGLIEKGLLVPGASKMTGLSGGAITSAVVAAGVPPAALLASYDDSPIFCDATLPDDWATKGEPTAKESLARFATTCLRTAEWPLNRVAASMRKLIPAAAVPTVSKTVQIFASQINPLDYRARVSSPMGPFSSKEDLITKIGASSDLPCLVSGTSFTVVNNSAAAGGGEKPYIDGGFTTNFNQLCAGATDTSRCITVTALQVGPQALVPFRDALGRCYDNVLIPPVSLALPSPYFGWANYPTLPRSQWKVGSEPCDLPDYLKVLTIEDQLVPPSPDTQININPGRRTPLPLTPCEWRSYRLGKANRTVSKLIYDHGVAEAKAFAKEAFGIN